MFGAWLDGELVGAASWQSRPPAGGIARIGPVFVRHPRFGIGRRLLAEVEARAHRSGFRQFAAWSTTNAVPFFERLGYGRLARRQGLRPRLLAARHLPAQGRGLTVGAERVGAFGTRAGTKYT